MFFLLNNIFAFLFLEDLIRHLQSSTGVIYQANFMIL